MKSFLAILLLIVAFAAADLPEIVQLSFNIKDGQAVYDACGGNCDDRDGSNPNQCDTYLTIEVDCKKVYQSKEKDNTDHPVFNEKFTTRPIRSDSVIKITMWDSDSGSSADDRMSSWKGTVDYFLNNSKFSSNVVKKNRQNSLNVITELVEPKLIASGNIRITIDLMGVVAQYDIKGNTRGTDSETFIIIKIEGQQVFKSKTIDYSSQSTFGQTFVSEIISVSAKITIELWGGAATGLMSSWEETAKYFAYGELQTLYGVDTASNNRENSLTIQVTYTVEDGNGSCVGEPDCDNCKQNSYAAANMKAGKCSTKADCYNGNCWAYCEPNLDSAPWCYTTKGASLSGVYVNCTSAADCNPCWSCAGQCVN